MSGHGSAHGGSDEATPIAAIDIGSDTVHLLLGWIRHGDDGATVERIEQHGELVELGRRVAQSGAVGEHAGEVERLVVHYVGEARERGARVCIAATEALRRATDGPALVQRLSDRVGVPVRVLSGEREAELGFAAVRQRLDPAGIQLIIDSGGASTEVTIADGRRRLASASLPVGAALLGAELHGDPPEPLSWALGGVRVGMALSAAPAAPGGSPRRAWATGGSAHNLAGLDRTKGRTGPQELTLHDLAHLAEALLTTPSERLARRSGEDVRRVAILPPGLLIVAGVLTHYGLDTVTVVPEGLREGMILAAAALGDDWWRDGAPIA